MSIKFEPPDSRIPRLRGYFEGNSEKGEDSVFVKQLKRNANIPLAHGDLSINGIRFSAEENYDASGDAVTQAISIQEENFLYKHSVMRDGEAAKIGSGQSRQIITINTVFLDGDIERKLFPILYSLKKYPLGFLDNELLRSSLPVMGHEPIGAFLQQVNINTISGRPSALQAVFQFVWFNHRPFAPTIKFRKDWWTKDLKKLKSIYNSGGEDAISFTEKYGRPAAVMNSTAVNNTTTNILEASPLLNYLFYDYDGLYGDKSKKMGEGFVHERDTVLPEMLFENSYSHQPLHFIFPILQHPYTLGEGEHKRSILEEIKGLKRRHKAGFAGAIERRFSKEYNIANDFVGDNIVIAKGISPEGAAPLPPPPPTTTPNVSPGSPETDTNVLLRMNNKKGYYSVRHSKKFRPKTPVPELDAELDANGSLGCNYGTPMLLSALDRAITDTLNELPKAGKYPMRIMDLSTRLGGYFPPHKSHQSGRDADTSLFYAKGHRSSSPRKFKEGYLDHPRMVLLLKNLGDNPNVKAVYLDEDLIQNLNGWLYNIFESSKFEGRAVVRLARNVSSEVKKEVALQMGTTTFAQPPHTDAINAPNAPIVDLKNTFAIFWEAIADDDELEDSTQLDIMESHFLRVDSDGREEDQQPVEPADVFELFTDESDLRRRIINALGEIEADKVKVEWLTVSELWSQGWTPSPTFIRDQGWGESPREELPDDVDLAGYGTFSALYSQSQTIRELYDAYQGARADNEKALMSDLTMIEDMFGKRRKFIKHVKGHRDHLHIRVDSAAHKKMGANQTQGAANKWWKSATGEALPLGTAVPASPQATTRVWGETTAHPAIALFNGIITRAKRGRVEIKVQGKGGIIWKAEYKGLEEAAVAKLREGNEVSKGDILGSFQAEVFNKATGRSPSGKKVTSRTNHSVKDNPFPEVYNNSSKKFNRRAQGLRGIITIYKKGKVQDYSNYYKGVSQVGADLLSHWKPMKQTGEGNLPSFEEALRLAMLEADQSLSFTAKITRENLIALAKKFLKDSKQKKTEATTERISTLLSLTEGEWTVIRHPKTRKIALFRTESLSVQNYAWTKSLEDTSAAVTSMAFGFSKNLAVTPIQGHRYPTVQYTGGSQTNAGFSIRLTGSKNDPLAPRKFLRNLQTMNDIYHKSMIEFREFSRGLPVAIVNPLLNKANIRDVLIENMAIETVEGAPESIDLTIRVTSAENNRMQYGSFIGRGGETDLENVFARTLQAMLEAGDLEIKIPDKTTTDWQGAKNRTFGTVPIPKNIWQIDIGEAGARGQGNQGGSTDSYAVAIALHHHTSGTSASSRGSHPIFSQKKYQINKHIGGANHPKGSGQRNDWRNAKLDQIFRGAIIAKKGQRIGGGGHLWDPATAMEWVDFIAGSKLYEETKIASQPNQKFFNKMKKAWRALLKGVGSKGIRDSYGVHPGHFFNIGMNRVHIGVFIGGNLAKFWRRADGTALGEGIPGSLARRKGRATTVDGGSGPTTVFLRPKKLSFEWGGTASIEDIYNKRLSLGRLTMTPRKIIAQFKRLYPNETRGPTDPLQIYNAIGHAQKELQNGLQGIEGLLQEKKRVIELMQELELGVKSPFTERADDVVAISAMHNLDLQSTGTISRGAFYLVFTDYFGEPLFKLLNGRKSRAKDFLLKMAKLLTVPDRQGRVLNEAIAKIYSIADSLSGRNASTERVAYKDLDLPPNPITGLVSDTSPDVFFWNYSDVAYPKDELAAILYGKERKVRELSKKKQARQIPREMVAHAEMDAKIPKGAEGGTDGIYTSKGKTAAGSSKPGSKAGGGGMFRGRLTAGGDIPEKQGHYATPRETSAPYTGRISHGPNKGLSVEAVGALVTRGQKTKDKTKVTVECSNGLVEMGRLGELYNHPLVKGKKTKFKDSAERNPNKDHVTNRFYGNSPYLNHVKNARQKKKVKNLIKHSFDGEGYNDLWMKTIDNMEFEEYALRRAFPAFQVLFVEEEGESVGVQTFFDEFFGVNAIKSLHIVNQKEMAASTCTIELLDLDGVLYSRQFDIWIDPEKRESVKKLNKKRAKKTKSATSLGKSADLTKQNPYYSTMMKQGMKVMVRMGYANNPDELETMFVGQMVKFTGAHMINMICQSYGSELVAQRFGTDPDETSNFWNANTIDLMHDLMEREELRHFGRWKPKDVHFFGGLLSYDEVRPDGKTKTVFGMREWLSDDNIFAPHISTYADYYDRGFGDIEYVYWNTTIWEVMKEMELRHPGYIAYPVPYGDRMTMFFGIPSQLYLSRPAITESEKLREIGDKTVARSSIFQELLTWGGGQRPRTSDVGDKDDGHEGELKQMLQFYKSISALSRAWDSYALNNRWGRPGLHTQSVGGGFLKKWGIENQFERATEGADEIDWNLHPVLFFNEGTKTAGRNYGRKYPLGLHPEVLTRNGDSKNNWTLYPGGADFAQYASRAKMIQKRLEKLFGKYGGATKLGANDLHSYFSPKFKQQGQKGWKGPSWNEFYALTEMEQTDRIRPFRNYVICSDMHNLIRNDLHCDSTGTFNSIEIKYSDNDVDIADFSKGEHDVMNVNADDSIKSHHLRRTIESWPNCSTTELAQRYCAQRLANSLKKTYKGEILMTGTAKIKPYDVLWISDTLSNMGGPVEVEEVVHSMTPATGFTTEVVPNMIVTVSEDVTMLLVDSIGKLFTDVMSENTQTLVANVAIGATFMIGGAAIAGGRMIAAGTRGATKYGATMLEKGKAVGAAVTETQAAAHLTEMGVAAKTATAEALAGTRTGAVVSKVGGVASGTAGVAAMVAGQAAGIGVGFLAAAFPVSASIAAIMAGSAIYKLAMYNSTREPLKITPLIKNNKPYILGLAGFESDSLICRTKKRWTYYIDGFKDALEIFDTAYDEYWGDG